MSNVGKENAQGAAPHARLMSAVGAALLAAGVAVGVSGVAFAGPVEPAPPVAATTVAGVSGGRLDWRPVPSAGEAPQVEASDGARVLENGSVRFTARNGTYDLRSGAAWVSYKGTVVLTYRGGEVTLRDPVATLGGNARPVLSAVVVPNDDPKGAAQGADATAAPSNTAAPETEIGELKTFGIPPAVAGHSVTWSEIPATLTAAGAGAFPSDRFEGADLGAVTVSLLHTGVPSQRGAEVNAAATTPGATDQTTGPDPTGTTSPQATDCPTTTPTDTTTPTGTTTPTVTPTSTPTGTTGPTDSTSPDPTPTDCASTPPVDDDGDDDGDGGTAGVGGDSLPKTGGAFVPLILTGAGLSAAGGGIMVAARRRAPHVQA
ncbi:hypothetical protein Acsp03_46780 [Actinomadura sp. NBRC 104412]|uniref:HtaA domain-containing protein n=1 Tax=Actinomadura sp. NBRC 104412 TaxID=3032203 RepID=UPI0024A0638B|nr:HtaA domain-containing protein [Actinomadura sp. NBRC 104412]GLZ07212.1 hypothetical protein Acsp03_46780 [Actinomadura sp. NBRC 104412]